MNGGNEWGVLLDLETYSRLVNSRKLDAERWVGLIVEELKALASYKLAVSDQTRRDDWVARNAESSIAKNEVAELGDLLAKADQLTLLKTRARSTLKCFEQGKSIA